MIGDIGQMEGRFELGGLWTTRDGEFRTGNVGDDKLRILLDMIGDGKIKFEVVPNKFKTKNNQPDYRLLVMPAQKKGV